MTAKAGTDGNMQDAVLLGLLPLDQRHWVDGEQAAAAAAAAAAATKR